MGRRTPKPALVGLFVLLAVFAAISTIIYVGSEKVFTTEETFLLYFTESINGLAVGAPVKFKGVPIGRVSDIKIRYNQNPASSAIPVFIKIDTENLRDNLGVTDANLADEKELRMQIWWEGLRGQLEVISFISGQLYIELDYLDDPRSDLNEPMYFRDYLLRAADRPEAHILYQEEVVFKEIPTHPSALAQLGGSATEIMAELSNKLSDFDIGRLTRETEQLLLQLNEKIEVLDIESLNESLLAAIDQITLFLSQPDMKALPGDARSALASLQELSTALQAEMGPLTDATEGVARRFAETLDEFDMTIEEIRVFVGDESPLMVDLNDMVIEFTATARSLRDLVAYLERNPGALLSGRAKP